MSEIPDLNIFMMCESLNKEALSDLPNGYHIRNCRRDELAIWKAMPFDTQAEAQEYENFMNDFFRTTYSEDEDLFFSKTLFACDRNDKPVGTCLLWRAYGEFNTIHWLKTLKGYEGLGIGRALLSITMRDLEKKEYPIYLHTQPGSYRAIKLYSDFGFQLLSDEKVGKRRNDLEECLPILEKYMPDKDFKQLKICRAPVEFLSELEKFDTALSQF